MTNTLGVCLVITLFCCSNLSLARQVPKECSKGPGYWCQSLKRGAECGAVGHCIGTVWETQNVQVASNDVADKFVRLFRQLKDVKDLINKDYLGTRVSSECHDVSYPEVARICKDNTAQLEEYLYHVLVSETTPEGMCQIIGMCNNEKVEKFVSSKKSTETNKQEKRKVHLVGATRCTWGPSYWCSNFSTGRECSATKHCVDAVWTKQNYPEDNDSVCKICTDMVQQARDQLESNQTQGELKAVFEGSCKLMPIRIVAKECIKMADDFVPELVETLASQMNPQAVCSVAGLCNNARIDRLLAAHDTHKAAPKPSETHKDRLVGASHCTWGPSYWCSNFSTGRECTATKHCVERVWSKMEFPEDKDDICKICTDMVTQARDQLESNETQLELKQVFEGSCQLIPIKVVSKECIKMADDFVPELVETLASQMNPQAVCSVAGLCNNVRIDQLLDAYHSQLSRVVSCSTCRQTVGVARKKFDAATYEDFLISLLQVCGKMNSLSDSCSMLVFKYYEDILAAVRKDLTPTSVCNLSGQCTYKFHTHANFNFPAWALEEEPKDDVPCEFCEQLVKHLRDVLVANTTEIEFYKVLKGLCKQTGEFKDECLHIAEQYYPIIYKFLVSELQPAQLCDMIGMCGKKSADVPISPLLPKELIVKAQSSKLIGTDEANSYGKQKIGHVAVSTKQSNVRIMGVETLPPLTVDRMFVRLPQSKTACSFCQYFLHYLQVELSDTKTEDAIKAAVETACDRLPQSIGGECRQFVTEYGPSVIALLVQEIDPASVCPALGVCAAAAVRRVSINSAKTNCPLCLFACEQLEAMLKNNRTEASIRHALDNLCTHLSTKLQTECVDFVDSYTEQLVEMIIADFNSQEICVYLKLCKESGTDPLKLTTSSTGIDKYHDKPALRGDRNNFKHQSLLPAYMLENDIETNEIPDDTVNGRPVKARVSQKTVCVVCEFVMKEIDDQIKDKHNEDEIKKVVHGICTHMPKAVRADCDQFVEKYADLVISLLAQELEPEEVCEELKLCAPTAKEAVHIAREEILDCAVCETVVMAVKKVLSNDKVDHNIVHIVEKSCNLLPAKYNVRVCPALGMCAAAAVRRVSINSAKTNCPLCLFACEQLEAMLKNNRTEASIRHALDNLCTHLSTKLQTECVDFVDSYTEQLVEMIIADFNSQEICVYLKLCKESGTDPLKLTTSSTGIDKYHDKPALRGDRNNFKHQSLLPAYMLENDIETNEIPDDTVNGRPVKARVSQKTVCVVCEFVMKEIDDQIKDKHNEDEIKKVVHGICTHMPKAVRADCDQFVEKYADLVISLLAQELEPEEVCEELKLCAPTAKEAVHIAREEILDCAVCETVVMAVKKVLSNDKVDHNIVHIVEKSCNLLPAKYNVRCHTMLEIYGDSVIHLIEEIGTKGVCQKIGLCSPGGAAYVRMHRN